MSRVVPDRSSAMPSISTEPVSSLPTKGRMMSLDGLRVRYDLDRRCPGWCRAMSDGADAHVEFHLQRGGPQPRGRISRLRRHLPTLLFMIGILGALVAQAHCADGTTHDGQTDYPQESVVIAGRAHHHRGFNHSRVGHPTRWCPPNASRFATSWPD